MMEPGRVFEDGNPMAAGPPGQSSRTGSDLSPPGNGGTTNTGGSPPQGLMPIGFHGTGGGLFKIMLINWILTILTLGIYSFWGKTKVRRYLCEQSSFVGDRFYYHGTGGELFKGALIFGAIFGLFNLGIYSIGQVWGLQAQGIAQADGALPYFIAFAGDHGWCFPVPIVPDGLAGYSIFISGQTQKRLVALYQGIYIYSIDPGFVLAVLYGQCAKILAKPGVLRQSVFQL